MRMAQTALAAVLAGMLATAAATAQEQPTEEEMMAAWQEAMQVGPEHEALTSRSGTWTTTTTYPVMPGSDQIQTEQGTVERTVTLEGRVLEERMDSTMMGQPYSGIGRTGYDNVTDRYWTTWNDTMSTGIILMHGDYDEASGTYTFEGTATDPLAGELDMRIEHTVDGSDRETMLLFMEMPGHGMMEMMEVVYERQ